MPRLVLGERFEADYVASDGVRAGEIYHVARNASGGATLTPVARFFAWRPNYVEGFRAFWRVDCFVSTGRLSIRRLLSRVARGIVLDPALMPLGRELVSALKRDGLCCDPIWLSVHRSKEIQGMAFGQLFDYE